MERVKNGLIKIKQQRTKKQAQPIITNEAQMQVTVTEQELELLENYRRLTDNCQLVLLTMAKQGRRYYPPQTIAALDRQEKLSGTYGP